MRLSLTLANRLNEVLLDGKWVTGTNVKNEIFDLDWKIATQKYKSLNTIANLTFHIDYYISGLLNVLKAGRLEIRDKYSFDYEPIKNETDWKTLVNKFCEDSKQFIEAVKNLSNEDLERDFFYKKYGNYFRNIDVIIEHSYYHLGQIMLIKKLIK